MTPRPAEVVSSLRLAIRAWACWQDGEDGPLTGGDIYTTPTLPASLRRRITPIGKRALEAAWTVMGGRTELCPRIILSSRHGEYARTLELLRSLAETGDVSPAEFSLAVHHGLAGLLSIATGNRAGHQAVAAGTDTLGAAFQEAAACLSDGEESVLLIHFDEALPEDMQAVGGGDELRIALALLLEPGLGELSVSWRSNVGETGPGPAKALCRLLRGQCTHADAAGDRMIWSLARAA